MSPVAERHETYLAEHGRFMQGRGASAPAWLRELRERGAGAVCRARLPDGPAGRVALHQRRADCRHAVPAGRQGADQRGRAASRASRFRDAAARIVILNGRFAPELSERRRRLPPGAIAGSLAHGDRRRARPKCAHLGQLAWEHAPFVALNTAFLDDGAFVVDSAERRDRAADSHHRAQRRRRQEHGASADADRRGREQPGDGSRRRSSARPARRTSPTP